MSPKLTVIIPTLNEEKYLPSLLRDLKNQTNSDFEVIIVDAHSKDNTIQKAEKFQDFLDISIYESDKKNVSHQRNLGARHAKAEYLFFIDADSRITKNCIAGLIKAIDTYKYLIFQLTLIPDSRNHTDELIFQVINYGVELSQKLKKPLSNGGSMVIHSFIFNKLKGFDAKIYLAEDHDIIKRAQKIGVSAKYLKNITLTVSLRRLQKDGFIPTLYKYSLAFIITIARGKVDKKLFEYDMGGEGYLPKPPKE